MSIIADALKKVQVNLEKNRVQKAEAKPAPVQRDAAPVRKISPPPEAPPFRTPDISHSETTSSIERPAKKIGKKKEIALIIFCSTVCLALTILLGIVVVRFVQSRAVPVAPASTPAAAQAPKAYSGNEYLIEGIMSMEDKSVVLINNQIHEVGDQVGPFTITGIAPDHITVDENGRTRILKVSHRY